MEAGDHSIADPLLMTDEGPRDASGEVVRAPIGNSAWTLVLFVLALIVGAGYWWWQRPADLTKQLGGREWVITHVNEEPLAADRAAVSTFVLDGTGEVRSMVACNTKTGTWSYVPRSSRIEIEWGETTTAACPAGPETVGVIAGDVAVDGATLRIDSGRGTMAAVALADLPMATPDELAGTWSSRGRIVEFGPRGLFRVDECRGEWVADGDAPTSVTFMMAQSEIEREQCEMDHLWTTGAPLVPVVADGSLYIRRAGSMFPLDREIVRLDPVAPAIGG